MSRPRYTMEDVMRHELRIRKPGAVPSVAAGGVAREIEGLHAPIIAECKRRAWKYVHSDPYQKTTNGEGVCDFIIYADGGRMFHIECKALKGKLSIEQQIFICWIEKLGHMAHVITSMPDFFEIVNVPRGN